jgi:pimeloyl-ACP methyl ester carboxylesterase
MIPMTVAPSMLKVTLITLLALALSLSDAGAQAKACGSVIHALEINNTTLHYLECGEGEPLVFVHGSLGDLHTFQPQVQTFATNFRVIAYSRRYFPPNAPIGPADVNSLSIHVADLGALVKALKAAPAHLVGNSYGAYIALALAVDHPELVRSLVLGEPPILPLLSSTAVGEAARQSFVRQLREIRKAFESGPEEGLRQALNGMCGIGCFDNLPQSRRAELVEMRAPEFRSHVMTEISAVFAHLNCADLGKLERPTLLVTGERSAAVLLLITAELERCLEGESQVMVPEAGHGPHSENPAFYNQAVMAFLQRR